VRGPKTVLVAALFLFVLAPVARASFHLMQIERVIGGVCGDTGQQAIQLRMRSGFQNLVASARMRAWDAAGANPVVVHNFATNVAEEGTGVRILSLSAGFDAAQGPDPDFILTIPIPATYLPAGKLTFEDDGGSVYWAIAWGGAAYTGDNDGQFDNDADGDFNPPFPGPLPWTGGVAIDFPGAAGALSTSNAADYVLTAGDATFFNNGGSSAVVDTNDCIFGDRFETGGSTGWSQTTP
jgi:hypothetical protein